MNAKSDGQLLREYAEEGSDAAFTEIVSRHMDLVHSAALRQVESLDLARDVAQTVFTDLARKASPLVRKPGQSQSLVGWLYRSTRFAALTLLRGDRRRQAREKQAMQEFDPSPNPSPDWDRLRPVLDEAMALLSDADREALLMRFFKDQDFRSVGAVLGVSDNTAQQRVIRALEKLREHLSHRGINASATALSVAIAANAVQAAPAGLVAAVSTSALLAGSAIPATTVIAASKTIAMTTIQKTLLVATVATAVGTSVYQARRASTLAEQVQTLVQQQAPLAGRIRQLEQERDEGAKRLALLSDSTARASNNFTELLRLRGEVGLLRRQTNDLGQLLQKAKGLGAQGLLQDDASPSAQGQTNFPRDSWKFAGFATPEDALQSYMWAKSRGDVQTAFAAATPELKQSVKDHYFKDKSDEEISAMLIDSAKDQTGVQILNKLVASDDQVVFQVHVQGMPDKSYSLLTLKQIGGEWKVSNAEDRTDGP